MFYSTCQCPFRPELGLLSDDREERDVSSLGMYLLSESFSWGLRLYKLTQRFPTTYVLGENERLVVGSQGLASSQCWSLAGLERLLHPDTLQHLLILFSGPTQPYLPIA